MEVVKKIHRGRHGPEVVLMRPNWQTFNVSEVSREIEQKYRELIEYVDSISKEVSTFEHLVVGFEERVARIDFLESVIRISIQLHLPTTFAMQEFTKKNYSQKCGRKFGQIENFSEHTVLIVRGRVLSLEENGPKLRAYSELDEEASVAFDVQFTQFRDNNYYISQKTKRKIRFCEEKLDDACRKFEHNLEQSLVAPIFFSDSQERLSGISSDVRSLMRAEAKKHERDGWMFNCSARYRTHILQSATDRSLREAVFRGSESASSGDGPGGSHYDNEKVLEQILRLRYRYAKLCSSPSFAHYANANHLLNTPQKIRKFIQGLAREINRRSVLEFSKMNTYAKRELGYERLAPWDIRFVEQLYLRYEFGFARADLSQYLTIDSAFETLFSLIKEQFGCVIVEAEALAWNSTVRYFEVYDHLNNLLGGFYIDYSACSVEAGRDEERLFSHIFSCRRKNLRGQIEAPLAVVQINIPQKEKMGKISHEELTALFHEVGHTLDQIFSSANYLATGHEQREGDFAEVLSIFMENWAWDIEVLANIIGDKIRSKKKLLSVLLALHRQRSYFEFRELRAYIRYALYDLEIHSRPPTRGVFKRVARDVYKEYPMFQWVLSSDRPLYSDLDLSVHKGYPGYVYTYLQSWKFSSAIRAKYFLGARFRGSILSRRLRREFIQASRVRRSKENLTAFFGTRLPSTKALLEYTRML